MLLTRCRDAAVAYLLHHFRRHVLEAPEGHGEFLALRRAVAPTVFRLNRDIVGRMILAVQRIGHFVTHVAEVSDLLLYGFLALRAVGHVIGGHRRTVAVGRHLPGKVDLVELAAGLGILHIGGHRLRVVHQRRGSIDQTYAYVAELVIGNQTAHRPVTVEQALLALGRGKALAAEVRNDQRCHARHMRTSHRRSPLEGIAHRPAIGIYIRAEHISAPARSASTARCEYIDLRTAARIASFLIIRPHGGHGDHLVACGRQQGRSPRITRSEDDDTARHRTGLHIVLAVTVRIVPAGVLVEVVERTFVGVGKFSRQTERPAVLRDHRTVIGRIDIGFGGEFGELFAVQDLKAHDPHAVAVARTAGHTAHADTVVVHRTDGTRHVGAVAVGGDVGRIMHVVPAVQVVVVVVVFAIGAVLFGLIHPDMGGEVFVRQHDTLVMHRNDDVRLAGFHLPGLEKVDVGTGREPFLTPVVVVVPLLRKLRIVEGHHGMRNRYRGSINDRAGDIHRIGIRAANDIHGLDVLDLRHIGKAVRRTRNAHVVPQVQSVPAATLGEPAPVAEHTAYLRSAQFGRDAVHLLVAGLHGTAGKHPGPQRSGILVHLDPYPPFAHFAGTYIGLRLPGSDLFRKSRLLGTGNRRKGANGHQ